MNALIYLSFTNHVVPCVEIRKCGLSLTEMGVPVLLVFSGTLYRLRNASVW